MKRNPRSGKRERLDLKQTAERQDSFETFSGIPLKRVYLPGRPDEAYFRDLGLRG